MSQPSHLDSAIASRTRQRRHQHESTATLHHGQVDSALTSCHDQHRPGTAITNMTQGLGMHFLNYNLAQRITADQAQGLEEYHSN
jgi:hypothetical protein